MPLKSGARAQAAEKAAKAPFVDLFEDNIDGQQELDKIEDDCEDQTGEVLNPPMTLLDHVALI